MSRNSYYYSWSSFVDSDAAFIKVYDSSSSLFFARAQQNSFIILKVNLNKKLFYGERYTFFVEYDLLDISANSVSFNANGEAEEAWIKIILPRNYYKQVWLREEGYFKEETSNQSTYTYYRKSGGRNFFTLVELVRDSETAYRQLQNVIRLSRQNINITVNYWAGDENKATSILNMAIKSLPVLEDIIGVPFPRTYSVVIKQSTSGGIGRWGGMNKGPEGILMPYESSDLNEVLAHEMSHYWATKPPFEETWMYEGQAELYAYLALKRPGFGDEAKTILDQASKTFNGVRNNIDLPLFEWHNPDVLTPTNKEYINFMYAKSFLFMLNIYEKIGLENIQKSNREVFSLNKPVNWFEYLNILEKSSGQDIKTLFAQWVLPKKFTENYYQWLSVQNAFRELESVISKARDSYGIQNVEKENQAVSDLIAGGNLFDAQNKIQTVRRLYDQWQLAQKIYLDAEKTISYSRNMLGIGPVEKELQLAQGLLISGQYDLVSTKAQSTLRLYEQWKNAEIIYREARGNISQFEGALGIAAVNKELNAAKDLLVAGQYNMVLAKVDSALKLFQQWQSAEKAYSGAYNVISPFEGTLGIAVVNKELNAAKDLLVTGQYNLVSSKVESALKLYEQWQSVGKSYGEAYGIILPYEGALGIAVVNKELSAAKDLLVAGQYNMVLAKVDSALKLFQQWQSAEKAYRDAYNIISRDEGVLGIIAVNKELKTAQDHLIAGQYVAVPLRVQSALNLYSKWGNIYKDYRNLEEIVSKFRDFPGIMLFESELKGIKDSLETGDLERAATGILTTNNIFNKWKNSYETYLEAQKMVNIAKEENRTWDLKKTEDLILEGETLLITGNLDKSTVKFKQAMNDANNAITPFKAISRFVIATVFFIILLIAVLLFIHRNRLRRSQIKV